MSKKTNLILLGVFVLLALAASYSLWSPLLNLQPKPTLNTNLNFSAFNQQNTDKISISKAQKDKKILIKENNQWTIDGFEVSQKEITSFFDALASSKAESLASKNKNNQKDLKVDQENGFTLALTKNGAATKFVIGKNGPSINSFYVRKQGDDNVYLASGSLRAKVTQDISAWRNKILTTTPKNTIQKVEISSKQFNSITISKDKNGKWQAESKGKKTAVMDEETANELVKAFNPLEASDFLDENETKEFKQSKNKTLVRVFGEKGKLAEISFLDKKTEWWAQVDQKVDQKQEILYKISSYKLPTAIKQPDKIFNK